MKYKKISMQMQRLSQEVNIWWFHFIQLTLKHCSNQHNG